MRHPTCTFELPRSIIISGATGAIGSEICRTLASKGVRVIAVARSEDRLRELLTELKSISALEHESLIVDFSDRTSVLAFGELMEKKRLEIDGIIVNPPRISPCTDSFPNLEDWEEVFFRVFLGPLSFLEHAITRVRLTESKYKRVAILSGISSKQVLSHYSLNNVIRSAWAAQAKTLAFSLGPEKIHINSLSIGGLHTPAYESRIHEKASESGISFDEQMRIETKNVPLGKYASIEETVEAVVGLLSGFTGHMTGVNFPFEGGYFQQY